MKKILAFIMILGFATSSCEPDDICDPTTPTTPRMLIQFYYSDNPTVKKNVDNLKVIGEGMTEGVILSPTATGDDRYITSGNNILLPLNTEADLVKYKFILNYGNPNPLIVNADNLEFNYTRENLYVSRACGFKTIFILKYRKFFYFDRFSTRRPTVDKICDKSPKQYNNENETIIKIYF